MSLLRRCALLSLTVLPVFLSAREIDVPTNVSVITREDLAGHPVYSVADALDGMVGLNVERDGSPGTRSRLKMRGSSSASRSLILLDGEPLTHEFDGNVDLSQIPLSSIERIEVTRGGASVAYGADAIGGVVNLITLKPDRKGLVADVATAIGRDGYKDSYGRFVGRSRAGDLAYAADRQQSGGFMQSESYTAENHFGSVTRSFNGKGYWGADYFFQQSRVGTPNGTAQPYELWNGHLEQEGITPNARREQEFQNAKLRFASPQMFGGAFYLTLKQGWGDIELYDAPVAPARRDEETVSTLANLNFQHSGFEAGMEAQRLKRSIHPRNQDRSHQNSAYVLKKWSNQKWTAVPGLRYDSLAESGGIVSPRLAFMLTPSDSWLLSATVARNIRRPTFSELFSGGGATANPDLAPEEALNYDAGVEWSPVAWFNVRLTGFSTNVDEAIFINAANRFENGAKEQNRGVETEFSIGGPASRLSAAWTAQKSERKTPLTAMFEATAMTPQHMAFVKHEQKLPWALKMTNEVRYQSEQFELDGRNATRIPSYYTWNALFSFKLWQADLFTGVHNVTNRRYADTFLTGLAPQPARTFWGGLAIRFIQ